MHDFYTLRNSGITIISIFAAYLRVTTCCVWKIESRLEQSTC